MDRVLLLQQQQQQIQLVPTTTTSRGAAPACATVPPSMMQPQQQHDGARSTVGMCPFLHLMVHKGEMTTVMAQLPKQVAAADCRPTEGELIVDLQEKEFEVFEVLETALFVHGECSIDEVTVGRNTVVHVAAAQGHHELIQELYLRFRDHEGLLSRRNSALDTPLHCAARAGHAPAVKRLVQLSRDCGETSILGCKNEAGDTALHLAARHGHGAAVEALVVVSESESEAVNRAGVSALYLAVISGSMDAVRAITTSCRAASCAGPSSQNALHAAVFQSLEMVQLLLAWRPALVAQADCDGSTPLHLAASGGDLPIVLAILGAAPPQRTMYTRDSCGQSVLHVAARMGHDDVVVNMLRRCLDASEVLDDDGRTFVHAAVMAKRSRVVGVATSSPFLRGRGGLLDAQDRDGNTALHLAVAAGAPGVVEDLLREGKVCAGVLNNDGHTAFDLVGAAAGGSNFFTMVSLVVTLVAYGAQLRQQRQDRRLLLRTVRDRDAAWIDKTSDSLAVVAVLIATSAFAAGFNLPGGYSDAGKAVLAGKAAFNWFLCLDAVSVAASVVAVVLLVYGKASRSPGSWKTFVLALHCIWVSLLSLLLALYAALAAVVSPRAAVYDVLMAIYAAIYAAIYFLSYFIVKWIGPDTKLRTVWRFLYQLCRSRGRQITRRQYPLATATVLNLILFSVTSFLSFVGMGFILALSRMDLRLPTAQAPSPL